MTRGFVDGRAVCRWTPNTIHRKKAKEMDKAKMSKVVALAATLVISCGTESASLTHKTFPGSEAACISKSFMESVRPSACNDCALGQCKEETRVNIGEETKSFGGACGAFVECLCGCEDGNSECRLACNVDLTEECREANLDSQECIGMKCAKSCGG